MKEFNKMIIFLRDLKSRYNISDREIISLSKFEQERKSAGFVRKLEMSIERDKIFQKHNLSFFYRGQIRKMLQQLPASALNQLS
jgi:hypothetical protein